MIAFRRTASIFGWVLCAVVLLLLWPTKFGGWASYTVVSGHSMEPLYHTGDLVMGWRSGNYSPGDIVVFAVPEGEPGAGSHVIHRLVSVDDEGRWTTRGDNRAADDPWLPTDHDIVGESILLLPQLGSSISWLPIGLAVLAGVIVTGALWPRRTGDDEPDVETDDASAHPHDSRGAPIVGMLLTLAVVGGAGIASALPSSAAELGGLDVAAIESWALVACDESPACLLPSPVPDPADAAPPSDDERSGEEPSGLEATSGSDEPPLASDHESLLP